MAVQGGDGTESCQNQGKRDSGVMHSPGVPGHKSFLGSNQHSLHTGASDRRAAPLCVVLLHQQHLLTPTNVLI